MEGDAYSQVNVLTPIVTGQGIKSSLLFVDFAFIGIKVQDVLKFPT